MAAFSAAFTLKASTPRAIWPISSLRPKPGQHDVEVAFGELSIARTMPPSGFTTLRRTIQKLKADRQQHGEKSGRG